MATDISGDGGVLKQIIKEGSGNKIPNRAKALVHYIGTFEDGKQFDASDRNKEPFSFVLGLGHVIKGWDLAVATMTQGEICSITCRYDYAYGEEGSPPTIPPKSTLKFQVELLGWDDPEPDTALERIAAALKKKDIGNQLFKENKFKEAADQYTKALDLFRQSFGFSDDERKKADEVKLPCFLNLAACQLRTKEYHDVVLNCSKALDIDNVNVKALFRRGQAYSRLSEFEHAKQDFTEALSYQQDNKEIKAELEHLKKKIAQHKNEEKKMFAGLFDKMSKSNNENNNS